MTTRIRMQEGRAEITVLPEDALPDRSPFLTALVEAAGALLTWDVTADSPLPEAHVHDADAASAWLHEVYGAATTTAVLRGRDTVVEVEPDPDILRAVLTLGHLSWARAWWPASGGVLSLDPALLAAEIAAESHRIAHLLDDEDAVERAVIEARDAPSVLAGLPPGLAADGIRLSSILAGLAEDEGVVLAPATPSAHRAEWALAAGGDHGALSLTGVVVAEGSAPVQWSDVPAQTVDAAAEARWALHQQTDAAWLQVEVTAVDGVSSKSALRARFGPAELDVDVPLEFDGTRFRGAIVAPSAAVFLPLRDRILWVRDPAAAPSPGEPESAEERARVLRFAADRLRAADATLAERAAAARA